MVDFSTQTLVSGVLITMIIVGIVSYFVGKRKTTSATKAGAMGFVFSIIPVLGIIYLLYLLTKEDI